ncbi:MAG: UDP-N-acetylglucosamine 1-carboxyvinyltransferase [Candidatus Microthrix sp.]|nr:UDP-N-acetylglucosamine 1-carboxyvinyltransferase [Candidatus Microthrix sp.]MBK7320884.1 UDP-N-acetylglucosamine 1-carboxyvinyltransferase [Candidatus Microthrix sp.]
MAITEPELSAVAPPSDLAVVADSSHDERWRITGGSPIRGEVRSAGAKNAVTKELVATLLTDEPCTFTNVPRIGEMDATLPMLAQLGTKYEWVDDHTLTLHTPEITGQISEEYSGINRIPILFMGPLLNRIGEAEVPLVGGCTIGPRPVDYHVEGLRAMGAEIDISPQRFRATTDRLVGTRHRLPYPSVGATENLILAAVTARGTTVIENAAMEPEVVDLVLFLQKMGANIAVDIDRRIMIQGVERLGGATHRVIEDRIEIASYAAAAVATGGDIEVIGAQQEHLLTFLNALRRVGGNFEVHDRGIRFWAEGPLIAHHLETDVHPGFMTDWQQPFVVLLTQADGPSVVHETVYENRFGYTSTLARMGANISLTSQCLGSRTCRFANRDFSHSAVITGPTPLQPTDLVIPDLRAGFAYVLAALIAEGTSTLHDIGYLKRGYEDIPGKLGQMGVKVEELGGDDA